MNPAINDSFAVCDKRGRYQPETPQRVHRLKKPFPPALLLGDHSVSDPPDPISNSAVKPDRADGTVAQAPEE